MEKNNFSKGEESYLHDINLENKIRLLVYYKRDFNIIEEKDY